MMDKAQGLKRRRLIITLGEETDRVLRGAAKRTGASEDEICRRAIMAYPVVLFAGVQSLHEQPRAISRFAQRQLRADLGYSLKPASKPRGKLTPEEFAALKPSERLRAQPEGKV